MGVFKKGDIVIGKLSYVDRLRFKIRPALVILDKYDSSTSFNNFVVLTITTTSHFDDYSISIYYDDIETGHIDTSPSYVRVNKPHILPKSKLFRKVATLKEGKMEQITELWEKYQK